jgi:hypothetical protein
LGKTLDPKFLYGPVHDRNYILGPGPDTAVLFGGILEIIVALAGIGTAVALYSVLRRQNQGSRCALSARESWKPPASWLASGVLAIMSLRQAGAGGRSVGHQPDAGHPV